MRILILTRYGRLGASSRLRSLQYLNTFEASNISCVVRPFISDELLAKKYRSGSYGIFSLLGVYFSRFKVAFSLKEFDLVWVEKEALPWMPCSLEKFLLRKAPYILDYDDAIFHNYDKNKNFLIRKIFGRRLDCLMNEAALVIGGNGYLAKRALDAGSALVKIIPTVIDLDRYPIRVNLEKSDFPRIVWIGSPSTVNYLDLLREPLRLLALQNSFVLRVIGAHGISIPGVEVECIDWTEDSEVDLISSCSVGIMPLVDSPWERGKCGYKLIQYMACNLPVVASAVGANVDIVEDGVSGFLVRRPDEWISVLNKLLHSSELRAMMGNAGRVRVEEKYCLQKTGPQLVDLIRLVAEK